MRNPDDNPLGIIAGGGALPGVLVQACRGTNRSHKVIAIEGSADPDAFDTAIVPALRLGEAAKAFDYLRREGVKDVVLAGTVQRPHFKDMLPDWRTAKFIARIGKRAFTDRTSVGDDTLLRAVISEFESEGFNIIGVDDVAPHLIASAGLIGSVSPNALEAESINIGFAAAKELGRQDIGQAVVVADNAVVMEESAAGTDALIAQAGSQRKGTTALILVKTMKPGQDRRMDLPTIGPDTVAACVAAGFRGIAIEAQHTLLLNKEEVAAGADAAGLFVVAVEPSGQPEAGS